jgi:osmotically-inducible protein OsmY
MKALGTFLSALALFALSAFAGCSGSAEKSPDVSPAVRGALERSGYSDVSVSEDRTNGVVTLGGKVASDSAKLQAESLAKSLAGSQVVADQIAVILQDNAGAAREVNADLDQAIEHNLEAALIESNLKKDVTEHVKNGVVTLTGQVSSQRSRAEAQSVATEVPNVQQVVNEVQVKGQKATASN